MIALWLATGFLAGQPVAPTQEAERGLWGPERKRVVRVIRRGEEERPSLVEAPKENSAPALPAVNASTTETSEREVRAFRALEDAMAALERVRRREAARAALEQERVAARAIEVARAQAQREVLARRMDDEAALIAILMMA